MIPQRKTKAKKAKAVFFRKHNDIDIFVEDTERGVKKLYTILFQKAFEGKYKVRCIYPLGGKTEVLKYWNNRPSTRDRLELYVIDSDFSMASFEKQKEPYNHEGNGLYYTSRFCIENYLISEKAAISYLDKKDTEKQRDEIKRSLNFRSWISQIRAPLQNLFFHFYTARSISEDIPVMRWKYTNIVKNGDGDIDSVKVAKICEKLKNSALEFVKEEEWQQVFDNIKNELTMRYSNNIQYYVCGKNYILGLLILKMKSITKHKENTTLIKQSLARNISARILKTELGNAI